MNKRLRTIDLRFGNRGLEGAAWRSVENAVLLLRAHQAWAGGHRAEDDAHNLQEHAKEIE